MSSSLVKKISSLEFQAADLYRKASTHWLYQPSVARGLTAEADAIKAKADNLRRLSK